MNNYTTLTRYKAATPRSARRQKGYTVPTISLPSGNSVSLGGVVMLSGEQTITSIKNFLAGIKIGGLLVYSSKPDTIFVDANLVVRGGVTAFGTNETISPSIFEALPIDGITIKRDPITKEIYVDTTVVGGGGGTGSGISIADVESYLTTNGYATQSWVTGRGYITSSALEPYALKTAIPTSLKNPNALSWSGYSSGSYDGSTAQSITIPNNTNQLNNGAGFITSITSSMVTNALGYTPLSTGGGTITATGRRQLSLQSSTDAQVALWLGTGLEQFSKGGFLQYDYSNGSIALVSFSAMANSYSGLAGLFIKRDNRITVGDANLSVEYDVLHSGNYSEYAVKKNVFINTAIADNEYGYGYVDGGWPEAGPAMVFGAGNYKAGVQVGALGSAIRYGYTAGTTSFTWRTILDENNYSNYALPKDGTAVAATTLKTSTGFLYTRTYDSNRIVNIGADATAEGYSTYIDGMFIRFRYGSAYTTAMEITSNGNVAIGGTSASEKLHVYGNILATGGITATNSSDERLKRNIRKFNAREVLMSLGGVWEYEYIDSEVQKNHIYEGTHYGLIYQHVKGTTLDVMCHEREDGFGTLNYIHPKFISLIAGATMENISEVDSLKREIRHLKQKVKQLENRA